MQTTTTAARAPAGHRRPWAAYTAAAWGFLFAVPSFYWALGGMSGAGSTVSPSLVKLAEDRVPWFVAVLWITGVLKVIGGLLGLALARSWGRWTGRLVVLAACGAAVLLIWHGALFIIQGILVEAGLWTLSADVMSVSRWYTFLWGPFFVLGGVAFALAARRVLRRSLDPRAPAAAAIGAGGGLLLSLAALLGGVG